SHVASAGRPFYEGFAPAAQMYGGAMAQQRQQAMEHDRWERQFGQMEAYRKAQTDALTAQTDLKKREMEQNAQLGQSIMTLPGMSVPQSQPTMGPRPEDMAKAQAKIEYLTKTHGLSPVAAQGVVGNLFQESGFNPNAVHDSGTGYGLAGWRLDRRDNLMKFAQMQGKPPSDPNLQLDFLVHEMKSGDMQAQRAYALLQQAKTPQEASAAMMHFFRPAGYTPSNPQGGHAFNQRAQYSQQFGGGGGVAPEGVGPRIAQGDAAGPMPQIMELPPHARASIAALVKAGKSKEAILEYSRAMGELKKEDMFEVLTDQNAQMYLGQSFDPNKTYQRNKRSGKVEVVTERKKLDEYAVVPPEQARAELGPGYDPNKTYQRNKATGKLDVVGGALVNINHQSEGAFTKQLAEQDAKRLGTIQENTQSVLDTVAKVRSAADLLAQTYTGPGAEFANAWYKALGAVGVASAKDKADAATAAQAIIADITPKMRVPGSGATSDFEMRVFGQAIPSLLNLPGGNEKVAQYWERIAERQMAIQGLAEKHAMESKRLTGTKFAEEVKALGPLFTKDEIKEMQEAAKAKAANRPPLDQILAPQPGQNMTPMPGNRPPLGAILGR
ncbi:MAG TPA: phage tail tip lysozyme, partial [Reyranellaceae bacterium]|nr:phage tail tip lysozyme [Reyranellaceae bacterium]